MRQLYGLKILRPKELHPTVPHGCRDARRLEAGRENGRNSLTDPQSLWPAQPHGESNHRKLRPLIIYYSRIRVMEIFLNLEACMVKLLHYPDVRSYCLPHGALVPLLMVALYGKVISATPFAGRAPVTCESAWIRMMCTPHRNIKLPQLLRVKRSEPRDPITGYTVTSNDALRHLDVRL